MAGTKRTWLTSAGHAKNPKISESNLGGEEAADLHLVTPSMKSKQKDRKIQKGGKPRQR